MPAATNSSSRLLIADDQRDVLEALRLLLKPEGFAIETAGSPAGVLDALASREFDTILIDLNYARDTTSGHEGLDLLSRIQAMDSTLPVIVMTAWGSVELAVEAMRRGARDFIQKPWENARLLSVLRTQVELSRALRRGQQLRASDWEDDLKRGLRIIADRSEALSRFMKDYARLTRLPKPQLQAVNLEALVRKAVSLETRMAVQVESGPAVTMRADPDQLQQLLINLVRNAVDASLQTGGQVRIGWTRNGTLLNLSIQDEGPGIANPANLFVPFFTTKPGGSGIGLVLCRQIAEAHAGNLALANRAGARGCEARVQLPL